MDQFWLKKSTKKKKKRKKSGPKKKPGPKPKNPKPRKKPSFDPFAPENVEVAFRGTLPQAERTAEIPVAEPEQRISIKPLDFYALEKLF